MGQKKRYAAVGIGGRVNMFLGAIIERFHDQAELVGMCDLSQSRMDYYNRERITGKWGGKPVSTYLASDFERMLDEQKPDVVIVCTMDSTHHDYIIRSMNKGCDVISEKPMTTDAAKANAIFDTIKTTGRSLRVSFNYRYSPIVTKVRELIMQGVIGKPTAVDFVWMLDTMHGADYFRRWHREKDKSGGLLVHKATHHFDLVNWWIDSYPKTVYAMGDLKFYGRKNAEARGEHYEYDRYTDQPAAKNDPFKYDLRTSHPLNKSLYLDAEKDTGYIRDRNVFGDNIDIEDTMAVMVRYRNNVVLSYTLNAYCPWEGFRVGISGDKGRIELYEKHGQHTAANQTDIDRAADRPNYEAEELRVFPMFDKSYVVHVPKAEGGHGGGDPLMLEQLFDSSAPVDPYGRAASHIDGAASILVGISGNQSIASGKPISVDDLLKLPEK